MESTKKLNKLSLNQESLRNLTPVEAQANPNMNTHHTCVVSNCPFPCTPVN